MTELCRACGVYIARGRDGICNATCLDAYELGMSDQAHNFARASAILRREWLPEHGDSTAFVEAIRCSMGEPAANSPESESWRWPRVARRWSAKHLPREVRWCGCGDALTPRDGDLCWICSENLTPVRDTGEVRR